MVAAVSAATAQEHAASQGIRATGSATGADTQQAACATARPSLAIESNSQESFYPGVAFGGGNTATIHVANSDNNEDGVTIERYSASGCLLESVKKTVPPGGNVGVRLGDVDQEARREIDWIRVVSEGKGLTVSNTHDVLKGDTLVSNERGRPVSRSSKGLLEKLNHRWTTNLREHPANLAYFINLSEYPVNVGACESDRPKFSCRTLSHTVAPMAQIVFRLDQSRRYSLIESTPGSSAAQLIHVIDGDKRVFGAETNITFGEEVPEK
jgi:hypothetical protein